MVYDLQKASTWKRTAAWIFDGIIVISLAVGLAFLLSMVLGYDGYSRSLNDAYARYETEYGIVFDMTQEDYQALDEAGRQNYDDAYNALIGDEGAMYAYNMMVNLTLLITSMSIFLAVLLWEFLLPVWMGNGQTLGKKIFGLCLVRHDGVKLNTMQLFTRTVLGKFTIETMIPVYILIMIFWGGMGIGGTVLLLVLAVGQIACVVLTRTNSAIHDLLAGTVVVDMASQMIFRTTDDLIAYKKKIAAEQAARQVY